MKFSSGLPERLKPAASIEQEGTGLLSNATRVQAPACVLVFVSRAALSRAWLSLREFQRMRAVAIQWMCNTCVHADVPNLTTAELNKYKNKVTIKKRGAEPTGALRTLQQLSSNEAAGRTVT